MSSHISLFLPSAAQRLLPVTLSWAILLSSSHIRFMAAGILSKQTCLHTVTDSMLLQNAGPWCGACRENSSSEKASIHCDTVYLLFSLLPWLLVTAQHCSTSTQMMSCPESRMKVLHLSWITQRGQMTKVIELGVFHDSHKTTKEVLLAILLPHKMFNDFILVQNRSSEAISMNGLLDNRCQWCNL